MGVGTLKLGPTGHLSGRVRSSIETVSDFSNTAVFIPGSSYNAYTRSDGTYTISNVPAAAFDLAAFNVDLGDAQLPNADNPSPVEVKADQTTQAPTPTPVPRATPIIPPQIGHLAPDDKAPARATAGNSTTLKVARYCVPWTSLDWDAAVAAAGAYLPGKSHLIRDDEWTALAAPLRARCDGRSERPVWKGLPLQ